MRGLLRLSVIVMTLATPVIAHAVAGAEVVRTVYFSAVDAKGAPVTDLTAADLAVKENGKDRTITAVEPATQPIMVSILVDDAGSGAFQGPVADFVQSLLGKGEFAIRAMNPQPMKLTGFTADVPTLQTAINAIGPRGRIQTTGEQMPDAIGDAAKELQQKKATRGAIIALTVGGEVAQSQEAEPALDALKKSGASLSVIYVSGLQLGQVLGDGPKRSGGSVEQIGSGVVPGPILAKIGDNLRHQYRLTYTLPDGVKPSDKLALTTSRKGLTLLAPSRVPDK